MRALTSMMAIAIAALHAASLEAQDVKQAAKIVTSAGSDECLPENPTPLYSRCRLSVHGGRLERGEPGMLIDRQSFLQPIALTTFVWSDSAKRYAATYERAARVSMWLQFFGEFNVAMAFILPKISHCPPGSASCARNDIRSRSQAMGFAGGLALVASVPVMVRGFRARSRAITMHNASLIH